MRIRNLKMEENRISFALDRGMYATVVLREILRADPLLFT
jgi:tRNA pseudouridine synthase D (TruD).